MTGTSSGIGEAVARELLESGWRVVGVARRPSVVESPSYTHLRVDLRDVAGLADRIEASVAPLMVDGVSRMALVNNAADPGLLGPVARLDPVAMLAVYSVNVAAPVCLMGWVVRRSPKGVPIRIVNVSSGAGLSAYPGLGAYGSAKAALRMAGMVLAAEVESDAGEEATRRDVTVLSYRPGPVDTPMQAVARRTPAETFPLVETFERWAREGILAAPAIPAAEIRAYVEADGHPGFHECGPGELKRS